MPLPARVESAGCDDDLAARAGKVPVSAVTATATASRTGRCTGTPEIGRLQPVEEPSSDGGTQRTNTRPHGYGPSS